MRVLLQSKMYAQGVNSLPVKITGEEAVGLVLDRMPLWPGTPQKREYLLLRAFNYDPWTASHKVGIRPSTVARWTSDDESFRLWDTVEVPRLRRQVVTEVLEAKLWRNLQVALDQDAKVLERVAEKGIDSLTKAEKEYFLRIRGLYTAESLLSVAKLRQIDSGRDTDGAGTAEFVVVVDGQHLTDLLSQQAGAKRLLEEFTASGAGTAVIDNETGRIVDAVG